jgi:hypothetical protein
MHLPRSLSNHDSVNAPAILFAENVHQHECWLLSNPIDIVLCVWETILYSVIVLEIMASG